MLITEQRNPETMHIDQMDSLSMIQVLDVENHKAAEAVSQVLPQIARAVDVIAEAFEKGGRLVYIGAGTSGRLGVLDASECPPTYGVSEEQVIGLIAGGDPALRHSVEKVEDQGESGLRDLAAIGFCEKDVLVGISAAGGAAYVVEPIREAKRMGAITVGITSNPGTYLAVETDIPIVTEVGPEPVTGSTRMKSGTAQKLVLNMLSTGAMIRTGKVYENLMINVRPLNDKLEKRCVRILNTITSAGEEKCRVTLQKTKGSIRKAIDLLKKEEPTT